MSTDTKEKSEDSKKWVIVHDGKEKIFVMGLWAEYRNKFYRGYLFTKGLTESQARCLVLFLRQTRWGPLFDARSSLPDDCEYDYWKNTTPTNFRVITEKEYEETRIGSK